MNDAMHSTFQRRKLGGKLRRMREQAGLSLDQAAPRLDKTRSALHRIETGFTRADTHLVRTMMDVYDCYQPELLEEVREANKTSRHTCRHRSAASRSQPGTGRTQGCSGNSG